ncbi:hypothetical protein IWZ03DRAFT_29684 [Phyllosticta citriasiana]|uniref:RRM domain-containing protein n=1 Tax=Phyllosticta citriasiana TaxID=595635 RepID=A0ABR1L2G2_9PEZI
MTSVHVEHISAQTSEKEIRDFFSFCGKISHLSVTPTAEGTQSATVTFEKETAAKTALLLDNTQLGPAQVKVSSSKSIDDLAGGKAGEEFPKEDPIEQEDKPRARIIAEYLAQGYVISDRAIEKALELDQKQGLSSRFTSALTNFDTKFKASERAQTIDSKYKVTEKANAGWRSLNSYFDRALGTPTGQKLRQFYEQGSKQVIDVHNEARHLANLKKSPSSGNMNMNMETIPGTDRTKCDCGANLTTCPCAPGKCACNSCAKNPEVSGIHQVPGTEKTTCNCSGSTEACGCAPGKCACGSCPKNSDVSGVESVPGTNKTKCNCGATLSKCGCDAGACACESCAKNSDVSGFEHVPGTNKTKCNCGANSSECPCAAGQCACADCGKNEAPVS